jgi:hypothetical protein
MTLEFAAEPDPSEELLAQVAALAPANPFSTPAYARAKRDLGLRAWVLGLRRAVEWRAACVAFVRRGRWACSLEVESLPGLSEGAEPFWDGLLGFCRRQRIGQADLGTFASPPGVIPPLRGETARERRVEHVLRLGEADLLKAMSSNHRRNIKRGQKAGLRLRTATDRAACQAHVRLMSQSLERRQGRGEAVSPEVDTAEPEALLRHGAGVLFQAVSGEEVQSSLLVLQAARGGYYQSAGTSPDGMACGASPWLVHEVACALRQRGLEVFNLGGAVESNPGLFRFKTDFGTTPVALEAVTLVLGSPFWRKCKSAVRAVRDRVRAVFGAS